MIFINYKSTTFGTGENAVALTEKLIKVQESTEIPIIAVVHDLDAYTVRQMYKGDVWLQHLDLPIEYGGTGKTAAETIAEIGYHIDGVFINHSEHRYLHLDQIISSVNDAKKFGIKTMVFAAIELEVEKACQMNPDYVSYEPPELVGSKTASVATAHPESINNAADMCKKYNIPLIVGAGVHTQEDVRVSVSLGATGIAVSTDIVKAQDPERELKDLVEGFRI